MTITIQINYITNGNKVMQQGDFKLRGKKPEQIALEFWRQIQREMPYKCELEKIIATGEEITVLVKGLEAPRN
ncbi:hypothetical protein [Neobacillus mesonae]|uniref:hypothetical protein n=1 Tax=Neobacillus mesonae TaxID=1193713 RepID=UPI00203F2D3B|nr:hypothetical protein [Neobacillus mesonae]MCM3567829.1 hypothetical protein [Neobacillus mesonae]